MDELDIANLQTVPAVSDNLNSDRDIQMWHKIEYSAKGKKNKRTKSISIWLNIKWCIYR